MGLHARMNGTKSVEQRKEFITFAAAAFAVDVRQGVEKLRENGMVS
jgi:hypothetical protein